ncbi:MAG TPA: HEAT repeat domain-containing protein [Vicinamibacterales bacterium]
MRTFALWCALALGALPAFAQQVRYDDVVRNLRNPDAKVRLSAVQLLHESKYPEAIVPIAALVNDPVDEIQLEAIGAELSFFLVEDVPSKKRVAFVVEKRTPGARAMNAFALGPLGVWPRPLPAELAKSLIAAIDDESPRVRVEAIYALGTIGRAPVDAETAQGLIKALDHYDPVIRAAAAKVIGRLEVKQAGDALLKAVNDSQAPVRYAAMRALGQIRDERAVQALTEQLNFYGKGEGAWSALDALARIAHATSLPVFRQRLADKDEYLRRAAAEGIARANDVSQVGALETSVGNDPSETVRAAMTFALQKMGRNVVPRLVEFLGRDKVAAQVGEYFLELGPPIAPALLPHLADPSPEIRANVAMILGQIGGADTIAALQPLTTDRDKDVIEAATRAIERIKMR